MLMGYQAGIFAMAAHPQATADGTVTRTKVDWYDPDPRAILGPAGLHVSRSLQRVLRRGTFDVRMDGDVQAVVRACAASVPGREDTWISPVFEQAVLALTAQGHVHSVEAWRNGALVGGVYGIHLNGVFFAESMFSRPPEGRDSSKVCLVHLAEHLQARGINLFDCQFLTHHLAGLGFVEVARRSWRRQLKAALMHPKTWS